MKLSKLVGLVLGAGCALLGLIGVVQVAGVGSRVSPGSTEDASAPPPPDLTLTTPFALAEEQNYAMIAERPLFNEDRKPDPNAGVRDEGEGEGEGEAESIEEPPPPLEVDVKGIIIGPEVKVAIVTDPKSKSTQRLKEGMPLEGELAAWTLNEIQPRLLVFAGQGDEMAEVELQVHKGTLPGGPAVRTRQASGDEAAEASEPTQAATETPTDPEARAEEIRRRVAERRAQLRAEAERRRAEREEDNDN